MSKGVPLVYVFMGSDSDLPVMEECAAVFRVFGIPFEMIISSAHRSPERTAKLAVEAGKNGVKVIIAGAGAAAHLAGVIASHTTLPVIGVPLISGELGGLDALLSTVQMPAGVPVAAMAIGKAGAKNAALLAVEILALGNRKLAEHLVKYRRELSAQVEAKSKKLQDKMQKSGK
jgi:phosphoribosylaminoimidazole carboxylase PurE protein